MNEHVRNNHTETSANHETEKLLSEELDETEEFRVHELSVQKRIKQNLR